jgi:hypothetical protein
MFRLPSEQGHLQEIEGSKVSQERTKKKQKQSREKLGRSPSTEKENQEGMSHLELLKPFKYARELVKCHK